VIAAAEHTRIAPVSTAPPELLDGVPIFAGLTRQERQAIASSMKGRSLEPGETIAVEGEQGVGFFVIETGTARVTVGGEERRTLGPGDYFGEIALLRGVPRTATVTAKTDVSLRALERDVFIPAVTGHHDVQEVAETAMATRLAML
jgi:CRP-like cAMP-binding protein